MKRILINATHNEEIRVALCKDNYLFDFDLENRTREQKKSNIYKGVVTRVEPSLEAVFVEYGSARQGFLPIREIAPEYLHGNPREDNLKQVIKEGDELIVQIEKEERGNKGAAISTYISLAGRYLVLMPNNAKGGGISRQISGKVRDEMRSIINNLTVPKGMSVIVRTAGIGKTYEDLQSDLEHLLELWAAILERNQRPAPCLLYQEAGVVTRAMRDYLRDDIGEIWIDSEHAYNEAAQFISEVMPAQMSKLRKYIDFEPMFVRFGIERQIESAYQREVRLPSGGSIVIDQTEAMVAIDINSAKSTKGSDVAETAFHTNLEAADEIARQLRLRDMGGLIVIDFIDMAETRHQKEVEKRLIEATRYDRARVQFAEISKFGLLEMSRQRLRPSLEEATGYICPRCHGNGMIRDVRSLALSIMRQIEQLALKHRSGEVQAEVPTEIAAFLLNEKRESLVYLEQDSGTRITVLPHAHLESPNFSLHFNPDGFAPATYDRITDVEEQLNINRGYEVNWQTKPSETTTTNHWQKSDKQKTAPTQKAEPKAEAVKPQAVAWLSNLFVPKPEARLAHSFDSTDAARAIESIVNNGGVSLGASGALASLEALGDKPQREDKAPRTKEKPKDEREKRSERPKIDKEKTEKFEKVEKEKLPKRELGSTREPRAVLERSTALVNDKAKVQEKQDDRPAKTQKGEPQKPEKIEPKVEAPKADKLDKKEKVSDYDKSDKKPQKPATKSEELAIYVQKNGKADATAHIVHLSLDGKTSKPTKEAMATKADKSTVEVAKESLAMVESKALDSESLTPIDSVVAPSTSETLGSETLASEHLTSKVLESEVLQSEALTSNILDTQPKGESESATLMTAKQDELSAQPLEQGDTELDISTDTQPKNPANAPTTESLAQTIEEAELDQKTTQVHQTQHQLTVNYGNFEPSLAISDTVLSSIATSQNRSKNDPRVVTVALSGRSAITGTAGEFIKNTLPDADALLAEQGFVACFIQALNHKAPTSFANYGYSSLTAEQKANFAQSIAPKGEFDTAQGKTTPPARTPTARAINDPRGVLVAETATTDETVSQTTPPSLPESESGLSETLLPTSNVSTADAPDEAVEHRASEATTQEPPVVEAPRAETHRESDQHGSSLLESAEQMVSDLLESVQELLHLTDQKETAVSEKTPHTHYKNMIENIAEQLLPQTGLLKLATPKKTAKKTAAKKPTKVAIKIPKADTKPKTEIVKRSPKPDTPSNDDNA